MTEADARPVYRPSQATGSTGIRFAGRRGASDAGSGPRRWPPRMRNVRSAPRVRRAPNPRVARLKGVCREQHLSTIRRNHRRRGRLGRAGVGSWNADPRPGHLAGRAELAAVWSSDQRALWRPGEGGPVCTATEVPQGLQGPAALTPEARDCDRHSGAYIVGTGETADPNKVIRLSAGGFFAFEPGDVRYAFVDEETVIQVNGVGPWVTNYINPADDPRKRH